MGARGTADLPPERERYAEALAIERIHGDAAIDFICDQIVRLGTTGDEASVRRWREIADRLDRLQTRGDRTH